MYQGTQCWPEELTSDMEYRYINYQRKIYTYPNLPKNVFAAFQATANRLPDKIAVVDDDAHTYTYRNMLEKVNAFTNWLVLEGKFHRGDHVALMMFNSIEFCIAFLSLNRIGAVVIPLPTKFKKEEVLSLLSKSDVTGIISDEKYESYFDCYLDQPVKMFFTPEKKTEYTLKGFEKQGSFEEVKEVEAEVEYTDLALLMFTSGTTSLSKGVTIRNYNVMHAIISYQRVLGITEEEKAILPVPIYLVTGLVAIFGLMMTAGGTVYLNKYFEAKRVLTDIKQYGITFFHASPTVFTLILKEKDQFPELPTLRMFGCGSSNMAPGKIKALHDWLPQSEFRTIYGLTETTSPGTVFPCDASTSPYIGSSGVPVPGMSLKIVDEDGNEVPPETRGAVLVKGTNITEAYYKLKTDAIQDGWLDTGDIGYVNAEGYLYIVDRKKDMINRGGEKVCSFDIENELSNIEAIEDAAVIGIPHDLYGEVPVALVKLKAGYDTNADDLKKYLKTKMAHYKVPDQIILTDRIPITENMKVDKKKIRQMFRKEEETV